MLLTVWKEEVQLMQSVQLMLHHMFFKVTTTPKDTVASCKYAMLPGAEKVRGCCQVPVIEVRLNTKPILSGYEGL